MPEQGGDLLLEATQDVGYWGVYGGNNWVKSWMWRPERPLLAHHPLSSFDTLSNINLPSCTFHEVGFRYF